MGDAPRPFYERSEAERVAMTLEAIRQGRTVFERWGALAQPEAADWNARAALAAEWLGDQTSIADLGCGTMTLERYLRPDQIYIPVDVVARDHRTIVCDLNREVPPATAAGSAACLGLIEYLHRPKEVLGNLGLHYGAMVVSYCVTDAPEPLHNRRAHAWVNDFDTAGLENLFREAGWAVTKSGWIDKVQRLWLLGSVNGGRQTIASFKCG